MSWAFRVVVAVVIEVMVSVTALPLYLLFGAVNGLLIWWTDVGFVYRNLKG